MKVTEDIAIIIIPIIIISIIIPTIIIIFITICIMIITTIIIIIITITLDITQVNPQLLIIVEGLEYAGNLQGARHHPVKLSRFISSQTPPHQATPYIAQQVHT